MRNGGEIIVEYLVREKVPYVFGLCGHGNVGLLDALYDRTDAIRVRARRIGRLGALRNPLAVAARDFTVRATPAHLALRGMDDLFNGFRLPE